MGLLSQNKYCAVVNLFSNYEDIEIKMRQLGAIDLRQYYERHYKRYARYKLRMKILAEKKAKKIARIAEERGVDVSQIDPGSVSDVSDVSDRELGSGVSSMTEAEDFLEMLSQKEDYESDVFVNRASIELDLNDFVPAQELKYHEENITESPYYNFYDSNAEIPIESIEEPKLEIPDVLKIYLFPRGDMSQFPPPEKSSKLGVFDYYLMDAASVLPVIALDVQLHEKVADYCAAPGGKALLMALTLRPSLLFLNDKSISRTSRLKTVFNTYIPQIESIRNTIQFNQDDAKTLIRPNTFDKILVDAICTNDRHSVSENDNNWFKPSRLQERIKLPEEQMAILFAGLMSLRRGGSLVYSTCSLSPIQNDGVVHMALKKIWEETNNIYAIRDLKETLRPLRGLYRMNNSFKYGTQVVPFMPSNCGPMYVSKIQRIQ